MSEKARNEDEDYDCEIDYSWFESKCYNCSRAGSNLPERICDRYDRFRGVRCADDPCDYYWSWRATLPAPIIKLW
jgi:hypothetical protein